MRKLYLAVKLPAVRCACQLGRWGPLGAETHGERAILAEPASDPANPANALSCEGITMGSSPPPSSVNFSHRVSRLLDGGMGLLSFMRDNVAGNLAIKKEHTVLIPKDGTRVPCDPRAMRQY